MDSCMTEKRGRVSNFNKKEELLLLQEAFKYKLVVECKITKTSNHENEDAWQKVLLSFNAKNYTHRSLQQIKAQYDNLKSKGRKEVAKQKTFMMRTGGGPASNMDFHLVLFTSNSNTEHFEVEHLNEEILKESHCSNPTKSAFKVDSSTPSTSRKRQADWNGDVPNKFKSKTTKKLSPIMLNPVFIRKEQFYKRKLELLEKTEEQESLERDRRNKRPEEHLEKMILLDLDIKPKQKQLKQLL